jgi:carotenoid cleavage dioxygenase-like enzyme
MSVIESQAQSGTASAKYAGTRRLGFESLEEELQVEQLAVSGRLPAWLTGTLVRVTPAKLEIGGKPIRHWFDGLAMLNAFSFATFHTRAVFLEARPIARPEKAKSTTSASPTTHAARTLSASRSSSSRPSTTTATSTWHAPATVTSP